MAAATGMNLGAISDPAQRVRLTSTLKRAPQQDVTPLTPPTFLVTQSLVSLLTEKGIRFRYSPERTVTEQHESKGERKVLLCQSHRISYVWYGTYFSGSTSTLHSVAFPPYWTQPCREV